MGQTIYLRSLGMIATSRSWRRFFWRLVPRRSA